MSTRYEQFIAANHALFACMESIPEKEYVEMTPSAQEVVCRAEGERVAEFFKNDSITFKSLAEERLAFVRNQH